MTRIETETMIEHIARIAARTEAEIATANTQSQVRDAALIAKMFAEPVPDFDHEARPNYRRDGSLIDRNF